MQYYPFILKALMFLAHPFGCLRSAKVTMAPIESADENGGVESRSGLMTWMDRTGVG